MRKVTVLIRAEIELEEPNVYPEDATILDCVEMDMECDPAAFFAYQVQSYTLALADNA